MPKIDMLFLTKTAKEPYLLGPQYPHSSYLYSTLLNATQSPSLLFSPIVFLHRKLTACYITVSFWERGLFVLSPDHFTGLIPTIPSGL